MCLGFFLFVFFYCASIGETEGSVDQTIPIVLTQQELEALVQQQQQLQDIHNQPEPAEPEPQHTNVPTGRPATALKYVLELLNELSAFYNFMGD